MVPEFKCTLLREKFTLNDPAVDGAAPVIALSNRIALSLYTDGDKREDFIVRAQNMHSCVRFCSAIAKEYLERGAIIERTSAFKWENLWRDVIKGYEKDWNPDIWCALYHKGRVIFSDGTRHPLLDIIEKCDAVSGNDYEQSVLFAENAFQQAGKEMKIEHDSNVALVVSLNDGEARCGVILRGATKKTTFNYMVRPQTSGADQVMIPTILTASAAFLEGVQLAFHIGMTNKRIAMGMVEKHSDEKRKARRGAERLINLALAIEAIEKKYTFNYRPERPDFQEMVKKAEEYSQKILSQKIMDDGFGVF